MCSVYFSFDFSDVERGQPVVYRSVFTTPAYVPLLALSAFTIYCLIYTWSVIAVH